ncbi:hypothetical protein F2P81_018707 [Scophthalmus maximus]|uniref:Uncharacterized protein n=1 Tax=Scophthalmus maximus TaxID=52904 RepID=A0A6A4SGU6_SCOMX|nr:hypothetical protein F2P81_018707 [Scophthalmus maximus]
MRHSAFSTTDSAIAFSTMDSASASFCGQSNGARWYHGQRLPPTEDSVGASAPRTAPPPHGGLSGGFSTTDSASSSAPVASGHSAERFSRQAGTGSVMQAAGGGPLCIHLAPALPCILKSRPPLLSSVVLVCSSSGSNRASVIRTSRK